MSLDKKYFSRDVINKMNQCLRKGRIVRNVDDPCVFGESRFKKGIVSFIVRRKIDEDVLVDSCILNSHPHLTDDNEGAFIIEAVVRNNTSFADYVAHDDFPDTFPIENGTLYYFDSRSELIVFLRRYVGDTN